MNGSSCALFRVLLFLNVSTITQYVNNGLLCNLGSIRNNQFQFGVVCK